MTNIDYYRGMTPDPDTPSVRFWYDRAGRRVKVTDAAGTREFTYNTDDLQLHKEEINLLGGGLYSKTITHTYEDGTGSTVAGRPAGFGIEGAGYNVGYGYDTLGRLNRVTGPGLPAHGAVYCRAANSELVEYLRYQSDETTTLASVQRGYEANRNLVDYVENKVGETAISKYDYMNDPLGRRKDVVYTGSAFSQSHLFKWGYNPRSELTTADRHLGTDPQNPGTPMTPGDYDHAYDNIGNRLTYRLDTDPATAYTSNEVNQYTATADPAKAFVYDDDGNLTQDGTFTYKYDAENRLIEARPVSPVKWTFEYDYMGRRVRRLSHTTNGSQWFLTGDQRFVYDGWNVVEVLNAQNATTQRYTWGLDLSGQSGDSGDSGIHGAGGIGGLLAVVETAGTHQGSYWYLCDANGNVGQLVKGSDAALPIAASYEYDAYGNALVASGTYAAANPFRFSTKWLDAETRLYYYGYRYYSPGLGRWINRDPIEEAGGVNLYSFVSNGPPNHQDPLGLFKWWDCVACGALFAGKIGGGVGGCAIGCGGWRPPNLSYSDCLSDCMSQFFTPCELWDQFKNNPAEWVGAAACVSCGVRLIIEALKPEPPAGCEGCPKPSECPPCLPGIVRVDTVPPSEPHHPCRASHVHYYVNTGQGPPPDCKCSYREETICLD